MAVTPKVYGLMTQSLWEGRVNLAANPLMCMLVGPGYTPNQNTHKFRSIVTQEIAGSGYVAGGKQVTGVQLTYDSVNKMLKVTGGPMVWPLVTFTDARYAVLYVGAPLPISSQALVAYVDFGENVSRTDEPFYIEWPAAGIVQQAVV